MEGTPLRILAQTAYPPAVASARVRLANHRPFLEADGIDLDYRPALTDREYRLLISGAPAVRKAAVLLPSALHGALRGRDHGLLLVHRLRLLGPVPGIDPPRRLDAYDFDDALFLGSDTPAINNRFRWAKQEAKRCIACLRAARLVIAGNGFLADGARRYAGRVEVVPSCVDPDRQPIHSHGAADVVTVGWIGSQTTSPYLNPVMGVFPRLNKQRVRAKLVIVGADTGMRAPWIEHRQWSLEAESAELANFDIGIMPQPDDAWARGKCGYKLLQYFSAGVPAVASPVGVAPELVGTDRGLLASTPEEWHAALDRLVVDADQRREQGAAARLFVGHEYSYRRWAPELARLLWSLA